MYICICVYIYTYIHAYTHTHAHTYIHACMYIRRYIVFIIPEYLYSFFAIQPTCHFVFNQWFFIHKFLFLFSDHALKIVECMIHPTDSFHAKLPNVNRKIHRFSIIFEQQSRANTLRIASYTRTNPLPINIQNQWRLSDHSSKIKAAVTLPQLRRLRAARIRGNTEPSASLRVRP